MIIRQELKHSQTSHSVGPGVVVTGATADVVSAEVVSFEEPEVETNTT